MPDAGEDSGGVHGEQRRQQQKQGVEAPGLEEVAVEQGEKSAGPAAAGTKEVEVVVDGAGWQESVGPGRQQTKKNEAAGKEARCRERGARTPSGWRARGLMGGDRDVRHGGA